ncbi:methyltransferase domain-containing protein [Longispora sp. K20-0274]|uniref:SAM-dependent methyltransferase n=1 Tax=Longispora sp. K20-0274 TaxID=3088255 RepID=UPI00399A4357
MTASGAEQIGRRYDESTPMSHAFNDGQIHLSYWYGADDPTPMVEASQRITRKVADALGLRPGERVLDAGCGLGAPAILIARETGAVVTGVTVSTVEVQEAAKRAAEAGLGDTVRFEHGDYMALPFADGSFDAVLAIESLLHAPDPARALAEFRRVLRPGGRLALAEYTVEAGMSAEEAGRFARDMLMNTLLSLPAWLDALRAAGFRVEEYTQCGPRVFGMGPKYLDSAAQVRDTLVAKFGEEGYAGLELGLSAFMAPGAERIGYAIVAARRP